MRYGLLFLSLAMLTSGGVAAQSALNISQSAQSVVTEAPSAKAERSAGYGSLPFTAARTPDLR